VAITDQAYSGHLDLRYFILDDLMLSYSGRRCIRGSVGLAGHSRWRTPATTSRKNTTGSLRTASLSRKHLAGPCTASQYVAVNVAVFTPRPRGPASSPTFRFPGQRRSTLRIAQLVLTLAFRIIPRHRPLVQSQYLYDASPCQAIVDGGLYGVGVANPFFESPTAFSNHSMHAQEVHILCA
jgi:hypothetical protein